MDLHDLLNDVVSNDLERPWVTLWNIRWHEASRGLSATGELIVSIWLQVIVNCGCLSEWFALTEVKFRRANVTLCGNCTSDGGHFLPGPEEPVDCFRKVLCFYRLLEHVWDVCDCKKSCNETIYDVSVYASGLWPHKSYQRAFYNKYVRGTSYGDKIDKQAEDTVSLLLLVPNWRRNEVYCYYARQRSCAS